MQNDFGYFEEQTLGKTYDLKLLRRLMPFAYPYQMALVGSILLVVAITVLDLALPYFMKIAIDRYIVPQQTVGTVLSSKDADGKARYIQVPMDNAAVREIVARQPDRFRIEGETVHIALEALAALQPEEVAAIRQADLNGLVWVTLLFLAVILADFAFNFVQKIIMEYAGHKIMHDLRIHLFDHVQKLSVRFFTHNPVGRLVTRLTNDIQNMHEFFTSIISMVFKDIFLLVGIAVVLIAMHWQLALVTFTVVPVVVYTSFRFSGRMRNVFRIQRIKIAEINTHFAETIDGIKVIQGFGREPANYERFAALNHENYQAGMQQIHVLAVFLPIIELLAVVTSAVVILYGGGRVMGGTLSLGVLVAFITYMRMFFRPIRDLADKYNVLQNAMASAERIFLMLDSQDKLPAPPPGMPLAEAIPAPAATPIEEVIFDNVAFGYTKDQRVLEDVNFKLCVGETLAVVGPTGAGKTSLINLVMRFYDPTEGQIRINDRDLRQWDTAALRSKIALVTQDPFIFSASIRDNILRGNPQLSPSALDDLLEAARCRELVAKFPQGIDTVLSEGGRSISSGERQLLSIARALARDPELIILDEATSYIDSETEEKIQAALTHLMSHRTAIVVAHRLSTARTADTIIVLNRGRVIESGSDQALMAQGGFYYRLNQLQR